MNKMSFPILKKPSYRYYFTEKSVKSQSTHADYAIKLKIKNCGLIGQLIRAYSNILFCKIRRFFIDKNAGVLYNYITL